MLLEFPCIGSCTMGIPPELSALPRGGTLVGEWGTRLKDARFLHKLQGFLAKMEARDRGIILVLAQRVANRKEQRLRR